MLYVNRIRNSVCKASPDLIYGVPRGGVVPAVVLSHYCGIPVVFSQSAPPVSSKCSILIVDDCFETGAAINKAVYEASTFTSKIFTLCLVVKTLYCKDFTDRCAYYDKVVEDDSWVVFPWEDPTKAVSEKQERRIKLKEVNIF